MSVQVQPIPATGFGKHRRKLTIACEGCRKRKARCSGSMPCVLCRKNSLHCEFKYDRQRRGPHPKAHDPSIIDASTSSFQLPADTSSSSSTGTNVRSLSDNNSSLSTHGEAEPSGTPVPAENSWREAIHWLLGGDESFTGEIKPSPGLVFHLLEVFKTHVNYQAWMLDLDNFLCRLVEGRVSSALIYAVCAVSVNFSRHPSVMSISTRTYGQRFARLSRRRMIVAPERTACLDRIQTLCFLALYEVGEANGKQAWCDITAAYGVMQLAITGDMLSADEHAPVDLAYEYLCIAERELCLGHNLTPSIRCIKIYRPEEAELESTLPSGHVIEMLDLLLKISAFSRKSHTQCDLNTLSADSEFMSHRQALDKFLLCHPEELQVDPEDFCEGAKDLRPQFENLQCSLAWHCCVIMLNRVYLPVPKIWDQANAFPPSHQTVEDKSQLFPVALGPFLEERIKECESSASTICSICNDLMTCEIFLLPSFMGYCCFQSSIILINQLRCTTTPEAKVVKNLKINFTILGAMRNFYVPAQKWVDTLFELYKPDAHVDSNVTSADVLFSTYFARFKDIKEPPYVPLEQPQSRYDALLSNSNFSTTAPLVPDPPAVALDSEGHNAAESQSRQAWLRDYQSCLQSNILDLDEEDDSQSPDRPMSPDSNALPEKPTNSPEISTAALQQHGLQVSGIENQAAIERVETSVKTHRSIASKPPFQSHPAQDDHNYIDDHNQQAYGVNSGSTPLLSQPILQPTRIEIPFYHELDNITSLEGLQSRMDPLAFDGYELLDDIEFFALLEAGSKLFPPISYPTYDGSLDWMIPDPPPTAGSGAW